MEKLNLHRLEMWLSDFTPDIIEIDGLLFFDRTGDGRNSIKQDILKYDDAAEAQSWKNIICLDDFLDEVIGPGWSLSDPILDQILAIYKEVWLNKVSLQYPDAVVEFQPWKDEEYGDFGFRIIQKF